MSEHPYCCDRFAALTSDGTKPIFWQEGADWSWVLDAYQLSDGPNDYEDAGPREIDNIRFCPFCGSRIDRPGLELADPWGRLIFHQDGTPVRWRDLATDGIYNVDYENKISRADGVSEDGPEFRRLPDTRPLMVNDVQALREDGTPVIMEDVKRGGQYGFDKNTHVILLLVDDRSPLEFIEVDLKEIESYLGKQKKDAELDTETEDPAEAGPS